ncbi:hypothetical protein E2320_018409 [Naja naja]|nr:hypothetical protein E2320_018409 [Naja naja]
MSLSLTSKLHGGGGLPHHSCLTANFVFQIQGALPLGAPQTHSSTQWQPGDAVLPAIACLQGHCSKSPVAVITIHLQHYFVICNA